MIDFDETKIDEKTIQLTKDIQFYSTLLVAYIVYGSIASFLSSACKTEREDENCVGD